MSLNNSNYEENLLLSLPAALAMTGGGMMGGGDNNESFIPIRAPVELKTFKTGSHLTPKPSFSLIQSNVESQDKLRSLLPNNKVQYISSSLNKISSNKYCTSFLSTFLKGKFIKFNLN